MDRAAPFASTYPLKILVSDSHHTSRILTMDMLIDFGYAPDEAVSYEALLSLAEKGGYDVILINIRIGGDAAIEETSGSVEQIRPLLIGISLPVKLHFSPSLRDVPSELIISRPTTREELIDQLKSCSILAGKSVSE